MKASEIAAILGISRSAVSLVMKGKTQHCGRLNLARITALRVFEKDFLYEEFKSKTFRDICDTVILKASSRDGKNFTDVRRLAIKCKQWNSVFSEEKTLEQTNAGLVIGLDKEPYDLFLSDDFWDLCEIAQRKSRNASVIEKACELQNAHQNFKRKVNKK